MLMNKRALRTIALLLCIAFFLTLGFIEYYPEHGVLLKPKVTLVLRTSDPNVEFWQKLATGAKVAAKEFGADIEIISPRSDNDVDGQIKIVDTILKYGPLPKAIILAPIDVERLAPIAQKIKEAGIQLISIDGHLEGNLARSEIGTDHLAAGKQAGEEALRLLSPDSRVFIINNKSSAMQSEREKGVRHVLAMNPNIEMMDTFYTDSEEGAFAFTQNLLRESNSVTGIITLNEAGTKGAAEAVKKSGLSSQVKIIGFSSSIEEIRPLEVGEIQSLVVEKPFNMGYLGVKTSVQLLNKEKINPKIDTGSEIVTSANLYNYEIEKLLFPFGER